MLERIEVLIYKLWKVTDTILEYYSILYGILY